MTLPAGPRCVRLERHGARRDHRPMTDSATERKEIRIACVLEVPGAAPLYGQTRELSEREASVQSPSLAVPGIRKPRTGDTGILTLAAPGQQSPREALKIPCRVAHVIGNVVGLQLHSVGLNSRQKDSLAALLKSHL